MVLRVCNRSNLPQFLPVFGLGPGFGPIRNGSYGRGNFNGPMAMHVRIHGSDHNEVQNPFPLQSLSPRGRRSEILEGPVGDVAWEC